MAVQRQHKWRKRRIQHRVRQYGQGAAAGRRALCRQRERIAGPCAETGGQADVVYDLGIVGGGVVGGYVQHVAGLAGAGNYRSDVVGVRKAVALQLIAVLLKVCLLYTSRCV